MKCLTLTLLLISSVTSYHHHHDHHYHQHDWDDDHHDPDHDFFKQFNDDNDSSYFDSEEYSDSTTSSSQVVRSRSSATERAVKSYEVTEIVDDIPNYSILPPIFTNFTIKRPLNVAGVRNITVEGDNIKFKRNDLIKPTGTVDSANSISSYLDDIREGIKNSISAANSYNYVNPGINVPNVVAKPLLFFDKIRQKTSDLALNVHKSIFKHFDDYK